MKKKSATIVFFGNERLATGVTTSAATLKGLIDSGYSVSAVVSNYSASQPRKSRELEVKIVAEQHNIPVLLPENPGSIIDQLSEFKADIGVLVAYGRIVPQQIIDTFQYGIVNIHPSLLPLHRGPTPIESAILSDENETGVSLMKLVSAMDAGPVYAQERLALTRASKDIITNTLLNMGSDLLIRHLPSILDGTLQPTKQNESTATYDKKLQKDDGLVDWNKPATQLEKEVRAFAGWPKSRTQLGGKEVIITNARVKDGTGAPGKIHSANGKLVVVCKRGALEIERLIPAGKHEMSAREFIAGYGKLL